MSTRSHASSTLPLSEVGVVVLMTVLSMLVHDVIKIRYDKINL